MAQNLKSGDVVTIIAGDNKGKSGKIVKMDLKNHKAMIEGIGIRERHMRATQFNPKGGKKDIHVGIDLQTLRKREIIMSDKYIPRLKTLYKRRNR